MDAQFEHLCRICAANTKCKNNSVVESVFIFKTLGLKDKISRHLFLHVAENDPLPKVLCKSCYRQVEATASLSNIAKHTQRVFRDFLLSTLPKEAREATAAKLNAPPNPPTPVQDIRESNHSSHSARSHSSLDNDTFHPIILTRPPETTITLAPHQQIKSNQKHDDIVVSLTSRDSEMCQQQKKPQCVPSTDATQYTNNRGNLKINNLMLPPRRNSVFGDTRYSSAPMSIAQRSMQQPPSLTPLHPEMAFSKIPKISTEKKSSPAGVINFIQTHGRITGTTAPSITTKMNKEYKGEETSKSMNIKNQLAASSSSNTHVVNNVGVPNLPTSVLQQKRRNLKNALSNISAIRDGQVSLLKSSHQRQTVEDIDIRPLVTTTVVPHLSIYGAEPSVEEALPEHIIIAAPKKKKEESLTQNRQGPPKLQKIITTVQAPSDVDPQASVLTKTASSMGSLTDAISLGNVIRDPDLLMLILKALKWPVTTGNCEEQMARLKNSKFAVIMSDSNLLQDTDLTQLLGPYLGPMMNVVQQQQKKSAVTNITTPSPSVSPTQTTADLQKIGDCTMYKLPPETSVQLVPSSPTDQEPPLSIPSKSVASSSKRPQRKSRAREVLVDGQHNAPASETTSNAALVTNELLNINAMLISQFGSNPADALNEALISMLKQQQESKSQRNTRRSRSASTTSTPLNLEDIILVEPQPLLESAAPTGSDINTFKMPSQKIPESPLITRPIVKRRKVAMQISEEITANNACRDQMPITKKHEDNATKTELEQCNDKEESSLDPSKKIETLSIQQVLEVSQAPTSTVPEIISSGSHNHQELECATDDGAATTAGKDITNKSTMTNVRKTDVKSALGQKLLEAIGLPQPGQNVPPESSRDTLRSALKRSLKQAQEQQQQLKRVKQEEPVKQMADSTTKPGAGESSEEHKKAIAERELELLKRKAKNAEKSNISIKDEKSERMDVSSSSSRNRRSRNKSKTDGHEEDSGVEDKKSERWDEDDDLPLKTELEKSTEHINRPTRTSKTMSKYYKSPSSDKALSVQKSQHAMGTRSARQR